MKNENDVGSKFYADVMAYFDKAAQFTDFPKGLLEQIRTCNIL